ncbi:MAG: acetate--CoA ligase family protein [Phycisphaerales bacterium]|nr:acetate--CoA ligase family protein [Phycisphaerales bacterium]
MTRLHEFQGKAVLRNAAIPVPAGDVARSPQEAAAIAARLARPTVIKAQAFTTSRAAQGGIAFADTPQQAADHAQRMLSLRFGEFPVTEVLVEEKLALTGELFFSLAIDERARAPVMILSSAGGSGVEERASSALRIPCDVVDGPDNNQLALAIQSLKLTPALAAQLSAFAHTAFKLAKSIDARSLEINPLAITADARLLPADCRITVDDYAVARHPELGIEIARELDHPPTDLERLAYRIEQQDHRGTFFFAQMNTAASPGSKGLIGFHGAGGGGSMMAMDAVTAEGFTIANFCDTSGNPSPAKVYRAARIILSQPGLIGYFGSGSGVASQEQFWSAYGLAKAFWELELSIPAVIRLGGNTEDRAVEILQSACRDLPATVEAYKKSDPPAKIASRFATLVAEHISAHRSRPLQGAINAPPSSWIPRPPRRPAFITSATVFSLPLKHCTLYIDAQSWQQNAPAIIARTGGLLKDESGKPAPSLPSDEFQTKDSELIAAEIDCRRDRIGGPDGAIFVQLDLPEGR